MTGKQNFEINPGDKIKIYSRFEEGSEIHVEIRGHVKKPDKYPLKKNMKIYDLIFIAGGLLDEEFTAKTFKGRADLTRTITEENKKVIHPFTLANVIKNQDSKENKILLPGDVITIYPNLIFNNGLFEFFLACFNILLGSSRDSV